MSKSKAWILAMAMAAATGAWAQERDPENMGRPGGRHFGHHEDHLGLGPMHPRLIRELGLSPDQEKKFKEQRLAFEKKKIQLHSDRAMLELDLRNVLSTYPVNQGEATKIGEKIAELEKKGVLLRVEGISKFLAALTPEQHRKLLDLQAELREKRKAWGEDRQRREGRDDHGGPDDRDEDKGRP